MKLIIATRNRHKLSEIRALLDNLASQFNLLAASDLPNMHDVIEDGATLQANALKKAMETSAVAARADRGHPFLVLADDTGLEVDALNGAPGVFSARFAQFEGLTPPPHPSGQASTPRPLSYADNNAKLLQLLAGTPEEKRTARFRCVIALVESSGTQHLVEGVCEGVIGHTERGAHGFGYDPLFFPKGLDQTFAELGDDKKNQISHRALALAQAREVLQKLVEKIP